MQKAHEHPARCHDCSTVIVETVTVMASCVPSALEPVAAVDVEAAENVAVAASIPQHAKTFLPAIAIVSSFLPTATSTQEAPCYRRSSDIIGRVMGPASEGEREWAHRAALFAQEFSHDEHSKVGCAVLAPDGHVVLGTNRFPAPLRNTIEPAMLARPDKYDWMTHAERDGLYEAVRRSINLHGSTVVTTKYPCHECSRTMGQLGVARLVSPPGCPDHPRWGKSFMVSRKILECWGIEHVEMQKPSL